MNLSKPVALAISTLLATLSFPIAIYTSNLVPSWISSVVVWFIYVPLYLSLRKASPKQAFGWAYLFGFLSNAGILYWIVIAMQKYGGLSIYVSASTIGILVVALAFYPAITFWLMARYRNIGPSWIIGSTAFVILEWSRVRGPFGGFPWATPAYSLYSANIVIQVGDLIGSEGLNFLIFLGNMVIAETIISQQTRQRLPKIGLAIFFLLFGFSFTYGMFKAAQWNDKLLQIDPLRVALLQGNIPQDKKLSSRHRHFVSKKYREMSRHALSRNPDLIVWPEAALPWTIKASTQSLSYVLPSGNTVPHVIGAATRKREKGKLYSLNSAFIVDAKGHVQSRYDKLKHRGFQGPFTSKQTR